MASPSRLTTTAFALGLSLALPGLALAAPPDPNVPAGTSGQDNASSGSTELGTGDTFSTTKEVGPEEEGADPEDPHANDATEFDIALGAIFSTGNAQNISGTSVANFRLRRTIHQAGASIAGNFGAAGFTNADDETEWEPNVGNVQGLARYDVFFAKRWTAFLQYTGRHDPFQLLTYRMNIDPGFAFYAINKPEHRLWFEAGYDFQYDLYDVRARLVLDEDGNRIKEDGVPLVDDTAEKFFINHAVRLYVGYSNKLSKKVSFDTSFEYLQSVIEADRLRFNYLAAVNTQLAERFSLAVTFTLRYDNKPLPDVKKLDTVTALSLAYRFF